ncbi:MAG: hypothetical protein KDB14_10705, partial [Planctomycetales bacterium]|nr:hypothetical protein [Planctomycetales bacterium]
MNGKLATIVALALLLPPLPTFAQTPAMVARWDFEAEEATPLTSQGNIQRDQAGPRPPEFPDAASGNMAVRLNGDGAHLAIDDDGPASRFDFANGDAITLEAWVRLEKPRDGSPMYVIGKGRTGNARFARDNQNWALRVVSQRGVAKLSFLFATEPVAGADHWRRWTSSLGFDADAGWHHIAVGYRFGEPATMRGWIDGRPTEGVWDMGGATTKPPVVDDDAVWIGSSLGGSPANSFRGWLDAVAIHRGLLDDKSMSSHFHRVGGPRIVGPLPETMPELGEIPAGQVLFSVAEGLPSHDRWLNQGEQWPAETLRWHGDSFLLPRLPLKHDAWGIRDSWQAPVLLRIAADVELPSGSQRLLLRARALGRLWIDGKLVARTEPITKQPPNGEEPVTPLADPPLPGARVAGYHQQEVLAEFDGGEAAARHRVVLELAVGGKNLRTETGELCVAVQSAAGDAMHVLRAAGDTLPLTDEAIESALAGIESNLQELDDANRRAAASSQDPFWQQRHQVAREWGEVRGRRAELKPPVSAGSPHPIDAFVDAKISAALQASAGVGRQQAEHFHAKVLPILRENCFRCHGEKDKGGLKLDSRAAALKAGESESPAVAP